MDGDTKVIIITGPCGVGKTTITNLLAKELNLPLISGDHLKEILFPDIAYITEYPEKLKELKRAILQKAKKLVEQGNSAIIDYVILGESYVGEYQKEFDKSLIVKVLFPSIDVAIQRDALRDCWTSGSEMINELYKKYKRLEPIIGRENYMDTGNQSPEETVAIILKEINHFKIDEK